MAIPQTTTSRPRLAIMFFAPPLAWFVQLLAGYALVPVACMSGTKIAFYVLSGVVALVTLAAGGLAFVTRGAGDQERALDRPAAPNLFVAEAGILMAVIFLVLIVATGVYGIFLDPCAVITMPMP